ncbi:MAG: SRPBCC domain-containing protein [Sulfolobales archaeon]
MRRISGELLSQHRSEDLIELLKKPNRFAECIPGVISYEKLDDRSIRARARLDISDAGIPEISSITSTLTITLVSMEGNIARYRVSGKAAGSSYEADLTIRIEPVDSGSNVIWQADVSLGKLLEILDRFIGVEEIAKRIADLAIKGAEKCLENR